MSRQELTSELSGAARGGGASHWCSWAEAHFSGGRWRSFSCRCPVDQRKQKPQQPGGQGKDDFPATSNILWNPCNLRPATCWHPAIRLLWNLVSAPILLFSVCCLDDIWHSSFLFYHLSFPSKLTRETTRVHIGLELDIVEPD